MKRIVLMAVFLVCGACQSAPTTFDENSSDYPPPVGSRFTLRQELVIPADSAHVDLQAGRPVSLSKLNQYHPYCRLDVQDVRETPQTLTPDEFLVKRVYREATDVVARRSVLLPVRRVSDDNGGPTFMIYRTVFILKSAHQPQVRRLSCERWDRPALGDHLSLREIRTALGDYFSVALPGEAAAKPN
jgi:hypothetical protein